MKNMLLSSVAVIALGAVAHAQDGSAVQSAVEEGISRLNSGGANITYQGSEIGADNSLTLSDVRIEPEDGDVVITTDWLKLTPSTEVPGDVVVNVAPAVSMTMMEGEEDEADILLESEGFALTTNWVLGAVGKPTVSIVSDMLSITGGNPDHPVLKDLRFAPEQLDVSFAFDETARDLDATLTMAALDLAYTIGDPEVGSTIETAVTSSDLTGEFTARSLPEGEEEFEQFLENGGSFVLRTANGPSTTKMISDDPEMPISLEGSAGAGDFEMSILDGGFTYKANFSETAYIITPNGIPLPPFDVSMAGGLIDVQMPVAASEDVRTAKVGLELRELLVGDGAWMMIDPAGSLPRDPATLELDLTADLKLDRSMAAVGETDSPMEMGEVQSVDLSRAYLTVAGATLDASGQVDVDNSGPFPMPNGSVDVAVSGVQTLVQTLVELGLVEQMQAGMVMGMMMAFAVPGEEPDTFSSKIEFKDGTILANGMPIQ